MKSRIGRVAVWLSIAVVAFSARALIVGAQMPEPTGRPELEKELNIMSRVLEESIRDALTTEERRARGRGSEHSADVTARYIPSVGAVFTVSVDFPILPGGEEKSNQEGPLDSQEADLWDDAAEGEGAGCGGLVHCGGYLSKGDVAEGATGIPQRNGPMMVKLGRVQTSPVCPRELCRRQRRRLAAEQRSSQGVEVAGVMGPHANGGCQFSSGAD